MNYAKLNKVAIKTRENFPTESNIVSRTAIHHAKCCCRTDIDFTDDRLNRIHYCIDEVREENAICSRGRCVYNCIPVRKYTYLVDRERNRIFSYELARQAFIDLVVDGLSGVSIYNFDGGQKRYTQAALEPLDNAFWLLQLFGAERNGVFVAFPFEGIDYWKDMVSIVNAGGTDIGFRTSEAIKILSTPGDPRWIDLQYMLKQILERLIRSYGELDTLQQRLVDLARDAYEEHWNQILDAQTQSELRLLI